MSNPPSPSVQEVVADVGKKRKVDTAAAEETCIASKRPCADEGSVVGAGGGTEDSGGAGSRRRRTSAWDRGSDDPAHRSVCEIARVQGAGAGPAVQVATGVAQASGPASAAALTAGGPDSAAAAAAATAAAKERVKALVSRLGLDKKAAPGSSAPAAVAPQTARPAQTAAASLLAQHKMRKGLWGNTARAAPAGGASVAGSSALVTAIAPPDSGVPPGDAPVSSTYNKWEAVGFDGNEARRTKFLKLMGMKGGAQAPAGKAAGADVQGYRSGGSAAEASQKSQEELERQYEKSLNRAYYGGGGTAGLGQAARRASGSQ